MSADMKADMMVFDDLINMFYCLNRLSSVKVSVPLPGVSQQDDKALIDAFYLLGFLTKGKVRCMRQCKKIDKRHYSNSFDLVVELKGVPMVRFLKYFMLCRSFYLQRVKNDMSRECVVLVGENLFEISRIDFWLNVPEEFRDFKWPIYVEFCLSGREEEPSYLLLNNFNFSSLEKATLE